MRGRTFLLGAGTQKGGTTWLHRYISHFACVDTGTHKEYHVWDAVHVPECRRFRVPFYQALGARRRLRWRMQRDEDAYFDYFAGLLSRPGIALSADLTPSHCGLKAAQFARIRDGFARRGIRVKVVFLMRDPVERAWSAVRMIRRLRRKVPGVPLDGDEAAALVRYARSPESRFRTRYDVTLSELEKAFPPEDIYCGFFEELFGAESVAALSRFLDVPADFGFAGERFNVSQKTGTVPEAALRQVAAEYADVYAWASGRFPGTRELWGGFALLDPVRTERSAAATAGFPA